MKVSQVDIVLLYIKCQVGHYYGCVKFESNDISTILNGEGLNL